MSVAIALSVLMDSNSSIVYFTQSKSKIYIDTKKQKLIGLNAMYNSMEQ